jgi:hypothetical protein
VSSSDALESLANMVDKETWDDDLAMDSTTATWTAEIERLTWWRWHIIMTLWPLQVLVPVH